MRKIKNTSEQDYCDHQLAHFALMINSAASSCLQYFLLLGFKA
jgi:hypothetical protein